MRCNREFHKGTIVAIWISFRRCTAQGFWLFWSGKAEKAHDEIYFRYDIHHTSIKYLIMSHEFIILCQIVFCDSVGKQVVKGRELFVIRLIPNVVSHEAYRERVICVRIRCIPSSTDVDKAIATELRDQNFN